MTKKGTTLKCVLLDANIIIEAYKLGIWGLQKRLSKQFTDGFFKALIKDGQQNLITGQGLRK